MYSLPAYVFVYATTLTVFSIDLQLRMEGAENIGTLVQAWKDAHAVKSGVGSVDGKHVFGPRCAGDEMNSAPCAYVAVGGFGAMKRVMEIEKEAAES